MRPKILITGGAGFIGRWVVKRFLQDSEVWVLDNLSNGSTDNIREFMYLPEFKKFVEGDIRDKNLLKELFQNRFDACIHLAARINVQDSIDKPSETFDSDVVGTFNLLEEARQSRTKFIFVSTCMVYDAATDNRRINEEHPVKAASPYAASKLAGEFLTLSYFHAYRLPTVVLRPFNTYGPLQKSTGEGGVIATFLRLTQTGADLHIYGDGKQTRDFLYVEDCAEFIARASSNDAAFGQVINAGSGRDITINDLASLIQTDKSKIKHVPHIHPQSEIYKLECDAARAKKLLGWAPGTSLEQGIGLTAKWLAGATIPKP